jgi:acyl-CoA synthetase (AMP-forming)/AMP-acid ligase II
MSEMTIPALCKPFPGVLGGRVKSVPGSTGILMPGVEARILREDGTEAGLDEPGELWLRSGGVALGYRDNEQASHETFVDGWLKSGDQFTVDKDGTFYFQDRIKVNHFFRGFYEMDFSCCHLIGHSQNLGCASVSNGD